MKLRVSLPLYDLAVFWLLGLVLMQVSPAKDAVGINAVGFAYFLLCTVILLSSRFVWKVYRQIWRYGGVQCYIRLLIADFSADIVILILLSVWGVSAAAMEEILMIMCLNTLAALTMRLVYRYSYKCGSRNDARGRFLRILLKIFSAGRVTTEPDPNSQKIRVAVIGAGNTGVSFAEDLRDNPESNYLVRCFIDSDASKVGRETHGVAILSESEATVEHLHCHGIQEVVFAVPNMSIEKKQRLYDYYRDAGFKIKVFDFAAMEDPSGKRRIREFDIEDLLMRGTKDFLSEKTCEYYRDKVVLITGGGGSIGSELCRQLARMKAKQLIIADIYENCAYDLQQSLKFKYKNEIDIRVEIVSIANKVGLSRVFEEYHPDICINAAAHKHVPLMEKNCVEAVENNVFGTMNVIQLCEEYGCERFMMVSTDKAVNPTNIMGATKRMCEMIMQAYSTRGKVKCSATRFGNVLGSAGSVIPLFKSQIANGGPVTLTDKRIIRYFMTIPEASQLVLTSGAMAKNGEIFVLDMGKPVKIYDLAKNMIRLSGYNDIEIVETGLRPGEKLYEELLVNTHELDRTDNDLIFVEKENPVSMEELEAKICRLKEACRANADDVVRAALHEVIPTFKTPEEVNAKADKKTA